MKTDSIFYRLFQEIPSIFFELIGNSPQVAELYQFSSVEVKQTAFRIDGVFLPNHNTDNPIYFLEVQFQLDKDLYHRVFSEISLYIRQNSPKNHWNAIVRSLILFFRLRKQNPTNNQLCEYYTSSNGLANSVGCVNKM